MKRDEPASQAGRDDPDASLDAALQPFEQALRQRFPSSEELLAEARAQTQRRQRASSRARGGAIAAAVLVSLIAAGAWLDPALSTAELRAGVGERKEVTLDGGDRLTLNSASVLRVATHLRSRQLTLERGEVLVSVARQWRPLTVHAAGAHVVDIGTVFGVRLEAAADDARSAALPPTVVGLHVTVLEGAVEVDADAGSASRGAPMRVDAGQTLYLARVSGATAGQGQGAADVAWPRGVAAPVDVERALAWRRGKLVFDGTPLAQAVAELQRYRAAPIRLIDPRIGGLRLSGEADIADIDALLDALPATLPVTVTRAADGSASIAASR